jgi:hypothetical protein
MTDENAQKTPGPLGISDWASPSIDIADRLTIEVVASDSFEVRRRI